MAFTPKGVSESLKGISGDLAAILKQLREVDTLTKGIETHASGAGSKIKATTTKNGQRGNGVGGSRQTTTNEDARFGAENVANRLKDVVNQHLGAFTETQNRMAMNNMKYSMVKSGFALAGQVASTAFNMLPDVGGTIQRATSYYNANVMSGTGVSRPVMAQATLRAMGGGLTAAGNDALMAQAMSMQGVNFSGKKGSEWMRTATEVGNAAKYLNMDNMAATQAITGMTSGQGSQLMMNRFGIFTSDPRTGKTRTTAQIFGDLEHRLRNGKKMTVEGINDSFRRGYLGSSLRNSGLSDDQQQMFKQYLIEKAKGRNMDLNDSGAMAKLKKAAGVQGNENPQDALQKINTSNTEAMQNAESAFVSGLKVAADHIDALNKVLAPFARTFGGFASYVSTMGGSPAGAGLMGGIGQIAGSVANMAGTAYMMKAMGGKGGGGGGMMMGGRGGTKANPKGGGGAGASVKPKGAVWKPGGKGGGGQWVNAKTGKPVSGWKGGGAGWKNGLKGGLKTGGALAALGLLMDMPGNIEATNEGYGGSAWGSSIGSAVGGVAGAAIGQALIPIPIVGGIIGGMVGGWLGGMAGEAIGSNFDAGTGGGGWGASRQTGGRSWVKQNGTGGSGGVFHDPTDSRQLNAGGGYAAGVHDGWDYQASYPPGRPVFSVYDGKVTTSEDSNGGQGNHIYIDHGEVNGKKVSSHYYHLSSRLVQSGAEVKGGQKIAVSGGTGSGITGPHLHVSIFENGAAVNPGKYLTATGGGGSYARSGKTVPDANGSGVSVAAGASASDTPKASTQTASTSTSGTVASAVSFRRQADFASLSASTTADVFGTKGSKASNQSGSMGVKAALMAAGFKGSALEQAYAVAMASSGGKANKKAGTHFGLFQFDLNGADGARLNQTYNLKNGAAALDPRTNALMAWDVSKHGTDWSAFEAYKSGAYKKFMTGKLSASQGINYVDGDQPINVHKGEAILDVDQAREWRQNQALSKNNSRGSVTINVTVQQASEAEARRLAQMVKSYLDDDSLMSSMGRM